MEVGKKLFIKAFTYSRRHSRCPYIYVMLSLYQHNTWIKGFLWLDILKNCHKLEKLDIQQMFCYKQHIVSVATHTDYCYSSQLHVLLKKMTILI